MIMAGVELEKYAIGHEMSIQGTLQLHFFALHNLYLGPF